MKIITKKLLRENEIITGHGQDLIPGGMFNVNKDELMDILGYDMYEINFDFDTIDRVTDRLQKNLDNWGWIDTSRGIPILTVEGYHNLP